MVPLAILVLAQGAQSTQEAPDDGVSAALIIGAVLGIVLVLTILFLVVSKLTKASRGGVEPVPGSRAKGPAPSGESVDDR
jgi:hypothetical protein